MAELTFEQQFPEAVDWTPPAPPAEEAPVAEETAVATEEMEVAEGDAAPEEGEGTEDTEEAEETEPTDTEKPKRKLTGPKGRISELVQQRNKAREELEYWRQQAMSAKKAEEPAPAQDPTRPKAEAFETQEEYIEALAEWKANGVIAEARIREQNARAEEAYKAKEAKVREQYEDYDIVMGNLEQTPLSPVMAQTILESDVGPALAYYLASHPDESAQIAKLGPLVAARKLGQLEARLETPAPVREPASPARPRRTATPPAVIEPVSGTRESAAPNYETMELADFIKMRNEEEARRRR